jgi:hypothetical protein
MGAVVCSGLPPVCILTGTGSTRIAGPKHRCRGALAFDWRQFLSIVLRIESFVGVLSELRVLRVVFSPFNLSVYKASSHTRAVWRRRVLGIGLVLRVGVVLL